MYKSSWRNANSILTNTENIFSQDQQLNLFNAQKSYKTGIAVENDEKLCCCDQDIALQGHIEKSSAEQLQNLSSKKQMRATTVWLVPVVSAVPELVRTAATAHTHSAGLALS